MVMKIFNDYNRQILDKKRRKDYNFTIILDWHRWGVVSKWLWSRERMVGVNPREALRKSPRSSEAEKCSKLWRCSHVTEKMSVGGIPNSGGTTDKIYSP